MFDNRVRGGGGGLDAPADSPVGGSFPLRPHEGASVRREVACAARRERPGWWRSHWRPQAEANPQDSEGSKGNTEPAPPSGQKVDSRRTRPRILLVTPSWADIAGLRLLLGPMADITVSLSAGDARQWLTRAEPDVVLWDLDLSSSTSVSAMLGGPEDADELERKVVYLERRGASPSKNRSKGDHHPVLSRPLDSREVLRAVAHVVGAVLGQP